jgi:hypothetical protein
MPFSRTYSAIPEGEDNETFLSGSEKQEIYSTSPKSRLPLPTLSVLLLLASVSMTLLGFLIGQRFPHNLNSTCTRHTSKYCEFWLPLQSACYAFLNQYALLAPILEDIKISYDLVEFDGRFMKENVFRQGAGPEVDEAWKSLGVECELTGSFTKSKPLISLVRYWSILLLSRPTHLVTRSVSGRFWLG